MYTSFTIENFRLFDDITIEPLSRVNLIGGKNNVGKTALLEALWIHAHPTAPRDALRIAAWRGFADYGRGEFFDDLFHQYSTDLTIKLQGKYKEEYGLGTLHVRRQYRAQQTFIDWSSVSDTELENDPTAGFDFDNELVFEYIDESGKKIRDQRMA